MSSGLFVLLVFGGLSALMIYLGYDSVQSGKKYVQLAIDSVNWPKVTGKIIRSYITHTKERVVEKDKDGLTERHTVQHKYRHNFLYEYKVKGTRFTNDHITFWPHDVSTSNQGLAEEWIETYPKDKEIEVVYNPDDPKMSILLTSGSISYGKSQQSSGKTLIGLGIALPFLVLIALVFF